ncbi:MAG: hypothetical protein LJE65_05860 [Desulfobacteraceae bacterium]|nr:hypothetical protein [Desulfobacteraceae bacterium]
MLSENICASSEAHLSAAADHLALPHPSADAVGAVREDVVHLQNEMKMMRDMVEYFRFYLGEENHA